MDSPDSEARRTLAAIVFTDVVNYTGRVADQEARMLKLVKRDLTMMSQCCEKFDGRVLKHTGDGLLLHFGSAVQAVKCAVQIQKVLANAETRLAAEDTLKHRIGIHLGDVFLSDDDIMGEGVNIASRLQQTAEPGGICFSQTVYDVVKNRLSVEATYLGPTDLKHIREKVPVYQIVANAFGQRTATAPAASTGPTRYRAPIWIGLGAAAAVLIITGVVIAFYLGRSDRPAAPVSESGSPVEAPRPAPVTDTPADTSLTASPPPPPSDNDAEPYRGQLPGDRAAVDSSRDPAADFTPRAGQGPPSPEQRFRDLDRDGDNRISRDEAPPHMVDRMMRADANGDGYLTMEELEAHRPRHPRPRQRQRPGRAR